MIACGGFINISPLYFIHRARKINNFVEYAGCVWCQDIDSNPTGIPEGMADSAVAKIAVGCITKAKAKEISCTTVEKRY